MEINNNRHNILSSTIAPDSSVKYWADLTEDPSGAVIKTFKDGKWTAINNDSQQSAELQKLKSEVANKQDKVTGKGLSTNDYTTAEKNKLAGLSTYNDKEVRDLISGLTLELSALKERVAALETPV